MIVGKCKRSVLRVRIVRHQITPAAGNDHHSARSTCSKRLVSWHHVAETIMDALGGPHLDPHIALTGDDPSRWLFGPRQFHNNLGPHGNAE